MDIEKLMSSRDMELLEEVAAQSNRGRGLASGDKLYLLKPNLPIAMPTLCSIAIGKCKADLFGSNI